MLDNFSGAVEDGLVSTRIEMEVCLDGIKREDAGLTDDAGYSSKQDIM